MPEQTEAAKPTSEILAAFSLVKTESGITVHKELTPIATGWEFHCKVRLDLPEGVAFPNPVSVIVRVPREFPFSAPSIFPDASIGGYPHQDSETGKLCLKDDFEAPINAAKLIVYIRWAREWLTDAATDNLLKSGEPYELPDFSRKNLEGSRAELSQERLHFVEDSLTFFRWSPFVGGFGQVVLAKTRVPKGLVPLSFQDDKGKSLADFSFWKIPKDAERIVGRWLVLSNICYERHRPPRNHAELRKLCALQGISLDPLLRAAWEGGSKQRGVGVILVGFPIPTRVGDPPSEIHWQLLLFKNAKSHQSHSPQIKKLDTLWLAVSNGHFADEAPLVWGASYNVSKNRMVARGSLGLAVESHNIALFGCGAIGSVVADCLTREGVDHLSLFDEQVLEPGNLCRHTADGFSLYESKAQALALRLGTLRPGIKTRGYAIGLPWTVPAEPDMPEWHTAFEEASLLIDCMGDASASLWLSRLAKLKRKRLVTMFLGWGAKSLTIGVSGRNISCARVLNKLNKDIETGQTPIRSENYFYRPSKGELVVPGAGCWHPTFPAAHHELLCLIGAGIDWLKTIISKPAGTDGAAAVLCRNGFDGGKVSANTPIVQLAWAKFYR